MHFILGTGKEVDMRVLKSVVLNILLLSLASSVLALEYYPLQVVFVRPETPTPVVLAVGTPEELAQLEFTIIEAPKYGVLLGIPPELVYVPQPGFVGTDWVTYVVRAVDGTIFDLGTVQLRVLGPAVLSAIALRFEGSLVFSGPVFSLDSYSFLFGTYTRIQYLDAQAIASFSDQGFTSFRAVGRIELEGTWPAAWRLPITSTLDFNPATLSLSSWTVDARTTVLGWNIGYYFFYSGADAQTSSYFTFTVQGNIDQLTLLSRTKFATLTPTFAEEIITLRGPWFCVDCPIKWELQYVHKKTGFDKLAFTLRDIPIPCAVCGPIKISADGTVTFKTDEKTFTPSLRVESVFSACLRPIVELLTPPGFGISGFRILGMEVRCDLPEGTKGRFVTTLDPDPTAPCKVTGDCRFFELVQFEGPLTPCCGPRGWWQTSFYFTREPGNLFGLAMADLNVFLPISREVLVNVRLKAGQVDPNDPDKKWNLFVGWRSLF